MKMEKKNFVTIVKELDAYYNGDIAEAFNKLNIYENRITLRHNICDLYTYVCKTT